MAVGGFTKSKGGYVRYYKGKTRYVASLTTDKDDLPAIWLEIKRGIDNDNRQTLRRRSGGMTLRELMSAFFTAMSARRDTGKPRPLSARMYRNYESDLNAFARVIDASTPIGDIGPEEFAAYAATINHLAPSGYDSTVAHVVTLFRWAVTMEYLDRTRFGGEFVRPAKREVRDARVARVRAFTASEARTILEASTGTLRLMIMLGICGGLNNSEVANLAVDCVDLENGLLDFRRRKTGKVRRVIPLPPDVLEELRAYKRPAPADDAYKSLFFLTAQPGDKREIGIGMPYNRHGNVVTKLFGKLLIRAKMRTKDGHRDGRSFAALRTTFVNLAPPRSREEVELIIGHAKGSILLDHYSESVDLKRLRRVVLHVWKTVTHAPMDAASPPAAESSASSPAAHNE